MGPWQRVYERERADDAPAGWLVAQGSEPVRRARHGWQRVGVVRGQLRPVPRLDRGAEGPDIQDHPRRVPRRRQIQGNGDLPQLGPARTTLRSARFPVRTIDPVTKYRIGA